MFWLLLSSAHTKDFLASHTTLPARSTEGGNSISTADPNRPKGYSIPRDAMPDNKAWAEGRDGWGGHWSAGASNCTGHHLLCIFFYHHHPHYFFPLLFYPNCL